MKKTNFSELDQARFGWPHVKTILVAGVGFFTDAYDLFTINLVVPMIGYAYFFSEPDKRVPAVYDSIVKSAASWGNLVGQLYFGYLADKHGRKKMYGIELITMIIATICCALSFNFSFIGVNIIIMFSFFRFILGIGIGGDYPLSAIIASEFANVEKRGLIMSAVFSMQGLGILVAPIVALIILAFYKPSIEQNYENIDYVWRFCIVFGIIPAFIALYFRLKIPESPRYTAHVMGNIEKAQEDMEKIFDNTRPMLENFETDGVQKEINKEKNNDLSFKSFFSKWKNLKILLGCSISWFALDVAFYGSNLNQSIVLNEIGFAPVDSDIYTNIHRLIVSNLVIVFFGTFPGYWLTVFTIEKIGRKKIQFIGFAVTGVCWLLLGLFHNYLVKNSVAIFIILYIIGQFFFNFGPNTTTFIIPGEIFPTRFKSTCHGIAAASGKAGAILSAQGFSLLKESWGVANLLLVFSFFMLCGFLATFWVPETMGKTLEELEEPKSPEYLIELKELERKKHNLNC